jgi:hypothetical protein
MRRWPAPRRQRTWQVSRAACSLHSAESNWSCRPASRPVNRRIFAPWRMRGRRLRRTVRTRPRDRGAQRPGPERAAGERARPNVLSELTRPDPDTTVLAWVARQHRAELCTTAISEAELAYGLALLPKGRGRDALVGGFQDCGVPIVDAWRT